MGRRVRTTHGSWSDCGESQRVLADLAGLSQPYLSQIETGVRPVERRATLVALANALDVSVADLTGRPGDPTDPIRAAASAHVPAIREALIRREVGELTEPHHDVLTCRDDFPEPAAILVGGYVWLREDVEGWLDEHGDVVTGLFEFAR